MNTRLCPDCKLELPLTTDYFHRRGDDYQHLCKSCKKKRDKRRYCTGNKKQKNQERKEQIRTAIDDYKHNIGCKLCPENTPCCLDFHHSGDKEFEISDGLKRGLCLERLLVEVAKCTILCANCHRKLHEGILGL